MHCGVYDGIGPHSEWVPERCAVQHLTSRCYGNTDEAEESEDDGDDDELDVLCTFVFCVTLQALQLLA